MRKKEKTEYDVDLHLINAKCAVLEMDIHFVFITVTPTLD